ncbi:hypothetical protein [Colwellia psychrerythraea]|uniref:Uncharacterized protein n=1 Tax=Colwellia psychrerythraea TaxID=28229 RepID=A0A099K8C2_COLPS|nr:hypothetical protein [Colwellia psychrerythraea]KGJ86999.1 hypothetical protein ND2E_0406 [Colwellia psychrerythraea]
MNCPVCNFTNAPNIIKEKFKYVFESVDSYFLQNFQEAESDPSLDSKLYGVVFCLNKFYFSYRNESIKDISIDTGICCSCVIDAIASLEDSPEQCRRKIMSYHKFETVPIHHFPLPYLNIKSNLDNLRANALLEAYDFNNCSTVEELISDTDISIEQFHFLMDKYFKIDMELLDELPRDDIFYILTNKMQNSDLGSDYREKRVLFYHYDVCQSAGATW